MTVGGGYGWKKGRLWFGLDKREMKAGEDKIVFVFCVSRLSPQGPYSSLLFYFKR